MFKSPPVNYFTLNNLTFPRSCLATLWLRPARDLRSGCRDRDRGIRRPWFVARILRFGRQIRTQRPEFKPVGPRSGATSSPLETSSCEVDLGGIHSRFNGVVKSTNPLPGVIHWSPWQLTHVAEVQDPALAGEPTEVWHHWIVRREVEVEAHRIPRVEGGEGVLGRIKVSGFFFKKKTFFIFSPGLLLSLRSIPSSWTFRQRRRRRRRSRQPSGRRRAFEMQFEILKSAIIPDIFVRGPKRDANIAQAKT